MPKVVITINIPVDREARMFGIPEVEKIDFDMLDSSWAGLHVASEITNRFTASLRGMDPDQDIPISSLDLSTRAWNCLTRKHLFGGNIRTVEELISRSAEELLNITHFGEACLAEVRQKLADRGLKLRDDP